MERDAAESSRDAAESSSDRWYQSGPYVLAAAGVGLSGLANLLRPLDNSAAVFLRVICVALAVLLAGSSVAWGLRRLGADTIARQRAALLVALANLAVLGAYFGLHQMWGPMGIFRQHNPEDAWTQEWDTMRLALLVLWWIGIAGTILVFLPPIGRKIMASAAIVFHFSGITTAVTAVNVGPASAPWLPTMLWNKVFRHYLSFAYLNNAYHFYSPEPGPPTLVWFLVEFEDDSRRWVRLANREDFPTRLQYQRMLALTESVNRFDSGFGAIPAALQQTLPRFYQNGVEDKLGAAAASEIQWAVDQNGMYHQPQPLTHRYIASYVRHVAKTTRSEDKPDSPVRNIRVYKMWHRILDPRELRAGMDPLDRTAYLIWYMGQYRSDGVVIYDNPRRDPMPYVTIEEGELVQKVRVADPFLYWFLPVSRKEVPGDAGPFLAWYTKMHHNALNALKGKVPTEGDFTAWKRKLYDDTLKSLAEGGMIISAMTPADRKLLMEALAQGNKITHWHYVDVMAAHCGDDAWWKQKRKK